MEMDSPFNSHVRPFILQLAHQAKGTEMSANTHVVMQRVFDAHESTTGNVYLVHVFDMRDKRFPQGAKVWTVIVKRAAETEQALSVLPIEPMFANEQIFYEHVTPIMDALHVHLERHYQGQTDVPEFPVPEYISHRFDGRVKILVIEDLLPRGYTPYDRKELCRKDYVQTVLQKYAVFHAYSMVAKKKYEQKYKEAIKKLIDNQRRVVEHSQMTVFFQRALTEVTTMMERLKNAGKIDPKVASKFTTFSLTAKKLLKERDPTKAENVCLIHADSSSNNAMFELKTRSRKQIKAGELSPYPADCRFIDFQMATEGSPAYDLAYFLFSSAERSTYCPDLEALLKKYHDTLNATLKTLNEGQMPNPHPLPFDVLFRDWKHYGAVALVASFVAHKLRLVRRHYSYEDMRASTADHITMSLDEGVDDEDLYASRIKEIIEAAQELGVISS